MTRIRWILLSAVAAGVVILIAVSRPDAHRFTGQCSLCHVGMKDPSVLAFTPDRLCLQCHPDNVNRSHPSNVAPRQSLPAGYPLYRGRMVCTTCHFAHEHRGPVPADGTVPVPGPYLLRSKEAGRPFCFSCHRSGFSSEKIDSHAVSMKTAHLKRQNTALGKRVDDNSRNCLSCHDGTLSTNADTQLRDSGGGLSWQHRKNIGLSHPIGVDYQAVYLNRPRFFNPPGGLDERINLINGKIGCETCHDHYSKIPKRLVMENTASRLCLACHNL